jgi:hypothetical protein
VRECKNLKKSTTFKKLLQSIGNYRWSWKNRLEDQSITLCHSPLASLLSSKCEEGKQFMIFLGEVVKYVKGIEELARPYLEKSWRGILKRRTNSDGTWCNNA